MFSEAASISRKTIGTRLDGIVGYNFLKHYKVGIDYPNETFALLLP
jgi:hypothetical protein